MKLGETISSFRHCELSPTLSFELHPIPELLQPKMVYSTHPSSITINMSIIKTMFRTTITSTVRSLHRAPLSRNIHCNTSPVPHLSTIHHSPRYHTFDSRASQSNISLQCRLKHSTTLTYEQKHQQFRNQHQPIHSRMSTPRKVYEAYRWLCLTGAFVVFAFLDVQLYLTRDGQKKEAKERREG